MNPDPRPDTPLDDEPHAGQVMVLDRPEPAAPKAVSPLRKLLRHREAGIFLVLIGLIAIIAVFRPQFLSPANLYTVSQQIAYTAIVALGVFFVILTGGIDLSIGSIVSLCGILCGLLMVGGVPREMALGIGISSGVIAGALVVGTLLSDGARPLKAAINGSLAALLISALFVGLLMLGGVPPIIAVAAALLLGALVGAVNGTIVSYIGVAPFIVTLGTMGILRGAVLVITGGNPVENIPQSFLTLCSWDRLGPPMVVFVLLLIAAVAHVILSSTIFGRRIYAVGGNEAATALSGINTRRVKLLTYVLSGLLSSVTGILYIARFNSAQSASGNGIEMDAIAAAVIGGTSLMGGEGTVAGVLIGAAIMGVIRSGLVQMGISSYWQELIIGSIIILAAILDIIRSRRR